MVDPGQDAPLPQEPLDDVPVVRQLGAEDLDGHLTTPGICSPVHLPDRSPADNLVQDVAAQDLLGHAASLEDLPHPAARRTR
jgi:hypothetical protein